jgi:hypothetical protein
MKFTLAIAFALLLATAYGFRVRQAEEDTCQADEWTTDYGVVCEGSSEWCNNADGRSNNTWTDKCEDGRYYKSECDDLYTDTNSEFSCDSTSCEDGQDGACNNCTESYVNFHTEDYSESSSYMTSSCDNADGSTWSKLAYLILTLTLFSLLLTSIL